MEQFQKYEIREEDGNLSADFLKSIAQAISRYDQKEARSLTEDLHEADLADVLAALSAEERLALISLLGRHFDIEALPELGESVRDSLMEALPNQMIASVVQKLDTDDAAYLIEGMDAQDQDDILAQVPKEERIALERALEYKEGSAGRLMQTSFVAVPTEWTVQQTMAFLKGHEDVPEHFWEVYVVDHNFYLKGTVPLARLLKNPEQGEMGQIMEVEQAIFSVDDDQEEITFHFEKYRLYSAAVVDREGRLVGTVTIDDVVEVIQEEATEEILRFAGVGDEDLSDPIFSITRGRFSWLFINLLTAILASWVISLFEATLAQRVALAVLMPIVASMGGNAGTQTMAVAVRALATRTLGPFNTVRIVLKESAVGLLNGGIFALLMGGVTWWWFGSSLLGGVIGAAMITNLLAAALAGILIPLTLQYFKVDPAVSSTVFVTTVTDVVGFFSFLWLASLWL